MIRGIVTPWARNALGVALVGLDRSEPHDWMWSMFAKSPRGPFSARVLRPDGEGFEGHAPDAHTALMRALEAAGLGKAAA